MRPNFQTRLFCLIDRVDALAHSHLENEVIDTLTIWKMPVRVNKFETVFKRI